MLIPADALYQMSTHPVLEAPASERGDSVRQYCGPDKR